MRITESGYYSTGKFWVRVEVNGYIGQFEGDDSLIEALIESGFKDDRK